MESHFCYWHKGLIRVDCIMQPVLTLLSHGGGKHKSISLQLLLWDSSWSQKTIIFIFQLQNGIKGMKETLSFMKTPYSHFPTLISRCLFSEENLLCMGLNLLAVKRENFNTSLDWLKKRGKNKPLVNHTNMEQYYQN